MNKLKVSGNIWINLFKLGLIGLVLMAIITISVEGVDIPVDKYEKRSFSFFFFAFLPLSIIGIIYFLTKMLGAISLETKSIIVKKTSIFSYKTFSIDPFTISKIEVKNGISTTLSFKLSNGNSSNIETLGLNDFEGEWVQPPYNQFMPSNPKNKVAHKIAYNISKKYKIPFKSEFIDN